MCRKKSSQRVHFKAIWKSTNIFESGLFWCIKLNIFVGMRIEMLLNQVSQWHNMPIKQQLSMHLLPVQWNNTFQLILYLRKSYLTFSKPKLCPHFFNPIKLQSENLVYKTHFIWVFKWNQRNHYFQSIKYVLKVTN